MKKYLNILFALALILAGLWGYGRNRPRALTECFPEGTWEDVRVTYFQPVPGEQGKDLDLAVSPEELKKAMGETPVFRLFQEKNRNCGVLGLRIFIDGEPVVAEILEDGSVVVQDEWGDFVCWSAADNELYKFIVEAQ